MLQELHIWWLCKRGYKLVETTRHEDRSGTRFTEERWYRKGQRTVYIVVNVS